MRFFPVVVCVVILSSAPSFAQTAQRRQPNSPPQAEEQTPSLPPNANSMEVVANEIGLLRKSLQALNARLREISEKVLATDASSNSKQNSLALNLELLTRAEQRAEALRKELFEQVEKETSLKSRLAQVEEDMRPDSIERSMNLIGSTRTSELRDTRRRILENERKGVESLLAQTSQSRSRLEDDVRQADWLVAKLRQHILPLIDKEIEKTDSN
jgi:hypothetical protein